MTSLWPPPTNCKSTSSWRSVRAPAGSEKLIAAFLVSSVFLGIAMAQ